MTHLEKLSKDHIQFHTTASKGSDPNNNQILIHETSGPCFLETKVIHNGKVGGDAGHGGKVKIEFTSDYINHIHSGTISVDKLHRPVNTARGAQVFYDSFSITLEGEWERKQFVEALKEIVKELE